MIFELNNNLKANAHTILNLPNMSSSSYPKQNEELLGCTIRLRFKSEYKNELIERYIKDGNDKLISNPSSAYFMVARFDTEYPHIAILINPYNEVIIACSETLIPYDLMLKPIPNETISSEYPKGKSSIVFNMSNEKLFNKLYEKEYIYEYPIQIDNIVGQRVYVDYESDRTNSSLSYNDNKLPYIHKRPSDIGDNIPVHLQDKIDDPSRVNGNEAYVIRADKNNNYPQFVVIEKIKEEDKTYIKFILSSEAHFYYDNEKDPIYKPSSIYSNLVKGYYAYGTNVKF